jgi:hypothetical protein
MTETRTIDVTGLPEPVVAGLQQLVNGIRAGQPVPADPPSPEVIAERLRRFDEWMARPRPPAPGFIDDSRESIYEGRGE